MKKILETIVKEELAGTGKEALKEGVILAARDLEGAELAAQEAAVSEWLDGGIAPVAYDAKEGDKNPHSPSSSVGHT